MLLLHVSFINIFLFSNPSKKNLELSTDRDLLRAVFLGFYFSLVFYDLLIHCTLNDIYHHFPTPSLPLMIEIIIRVNDDNDGRPLKWFALKCGVKLFCKHNCIDFLLLVNRASCPVLMYDLILKTKRDRYNQIKHFSFQKTQSCSAGAAVQILYRNEWQGSVLHKILFDKRKSLSISQSGIIEPTCAYARWALVHRSVYVCAKIQTRS